MVLTQSTLYPLLTVHCEESQVLFPVESITCWGKTDRPYTKTMYISIEEKAFRNMVNGKLF